MIIWVPKIYGLCHTSNEPTVGGITKINMSMKGGFHLHSQVIYLNVWLFLFSAVKMYVVPHVIPSLWTALQFFTKCSIKHSSVRLICTKQHFLPWNVCKWYLVISKTHGSVCLYTFTLGAAQPYLLHSRRKQITTAVHYPAPLEM